jgi:hypothetical protein
LLTVESAKSFNKKANLLPLLALKKLLKISNSDSDKKQSFNANLG